MELKDSRSEARRADLAGPKQSAAWQAAASELCKKCRGNFDLAHGLFSHIAQQDGPDALAWLAALEQAGAVADLKCPRIWGTSAGPHYPFLSEFMRDCAHGKNRFGAAHLQALRRLGVPYSGQGEHVEGMDSMLRLSMQGSGKQEGLDRCCGILADLGADLWTGSAGRAGAARQLCAKPWGLRAAAHCAGVLGPERAARMFMSDRGLQKDLGSALNELLSSKRMQMGFREKVELAQETLEAFGQDPAKWRTPSGAALWKMAMQGQGQPGFEEGLAALKGKPESEAGYLEGWAKRAGSLNSGYWQDGQEVAGLAAAAAAAGKLVKKASPELRRRFVESCAKTARPGMGFPAGALAECFGTDPGEEAWKRLEASLPEILDDPKYASMKEKRLLSGQTGPARGAFRKGKSI